MVLYNLVVTCPRSTQGFSARKHRAVSYQNAYLNYSHMAFRTKEMDISEAKKLTRSLIRKKCLLFYRKRRTLLHIDKVKYFPDAMH